MRSRSAAAVLAILLAVYAAHAFHYWFLIDDAYISFRYARNLVDGNGLVYNPGERVEGYSNLLWVLLMTVGMMARIPPEMLSRVLGLLSGCLLLVLTWRLTRRLLPRENLSRWIGLLPVLLLASNRSVAAWTTGGLETRFFTLLLVGGLLLLDREIAGGPGSFPWSGLPLGLLVLTRADGVLPTCLLLAAVFLQRKGRPGRHGLCLGVWVMGAVIAQSAFRLAYYGEILPNTFFVKVVGWPVSEGLSYVRLAAFSYGLPVAGVLAFASLEGRKTRSRLPGVLLLLVIVHLAYVVSLGGDHFEFRFLDLVWPLLAVLAVVGARRLMGSPPRGLSAVLASGLVLGLLAWNVVPAFRGFRDTPELVSVETEARYCALWTEIGRWFGEHAAPDEVIALRPAGVIPYVSGLRALDMLGLNDRVIARREAAPTEVVVPGHTKIATAEDVLVRGRASYILDHPNIHAQPPPLDPPRITEVAGRRFVLFPARASMGGFWLRFYVVSEEAAAGGVIDPSRVTTRIKP